MEGVMRRFSPSRCWFGDRDHQGNYSSISTIDNRLEVRSHDGCRDGQCV